MLVDSVTVCDPLTIHHKVRGRRRDSHRIWTVQSMDLRRWNVPRSRSLIAVVVVVVVSDDKGVAEVESVGGWGGRWRGAFVLEGGGHQRRQR